MLSNFSEIRNAARTIKGSRVAVPFGHDASSLEALLEASDSGLAGSIIVGLKEEVNKSLKELDRELPGDMSVIHCEDPEEAALKAVSLVSSGEATMLMKGLIKTSIFLKAVLNKEFGLRTGRVLSHVAVVHAPRQDRLVAITDGGMNIRPDREETIQIALNAGDIMLKLGADRVRIALLAAVEVANEKMPETVLWKQIAEEGIHGVDIAGPVAVDGAMDPEAAAIKKMEGPVAGRANVLVTPDIACGNIFAKGFMYMTNTEVGGLIAGAGAPVVMLSRSDSASTKLNSLALGVVAAGGKQ
ncbi:MAG: phosphate acyltransferase [Candidatus Fermentibacteria bacterium]|nr:phosphate acyltransferase [Candidatus Fermentibacteria bacterium]